MGTFLISNSNRKNFEFKTQEKIVNDFVSKLGLHEFVRIYERLYNKNLEYMYNDTYLSKTKCFYFSDEDIYNYEIKKEKGFFTIINMKDNKEYKIYSNKIFGNDIPKFIFELKDVINKKLKVKLKDCSLGQIVIDSI